MQQSDPRPISHDSTQRFPFAERLLSEGGFRRFYHRFGLIFVLEGAAAFRRILDILFALGCLTALSPLWLAVIVLVARRRRPLLGRRPMIGRWCEPYEEFRLETPPGPMGEVMRWFRLDRLPKLLNLLRGDLSIIGPRALDPSALTPAIRQSRRQFDVRPGLFRFWWIRDPRPQASELMFAANPARERPNFRHDLQDMIRAFPTILYTGGALWAPDQVNILGVAIDNLTVSEAVQEIRRLVASGAGGQITLVTAGHVTIAHQDSAYREVLERARLRLTGSRAIRFAAKILGQELRSFITPAALLDGLIDSTRDRPHSAPLRLFVLGSDEQCLPLFLGHFAGRSPGIEFCGSAVFHGNPLADEALPTIIRASGADLLLAGIPAPALEIWLDRNGHDLAPVVTFGIGDRIEEIIDQETRRAPPPPEAWSILGLADIWDCWHHRSGVCPLTLLANATLLVRVFLERAGRRSPAPRFDVPKF